MRQPASFPIASQACFAVTDVFKGWGNNKRNLVPWMVRLCRYTLRVDVPRLLALLGLSKPVSNEAKEYNDVADVLYGMQQKAADALANIRAEHGDAIDAF